MANTVENYLEILELKGKVSLEEIKAAYRIMAKKYHPDVSGKDTTVIFLKIQEAFEYLEKNFHLVENIKQKKQFNYKADANPISKKRQHYYRILTNDYLIISLPEETLTEDITIMCIYEMKEFKLNFDKGTKFPMKIKVVNPPLTIKIIAGSLAW